MPAAPATEAAIRRAIQAVRAQGLAIGAVVVASDGTIRIETRPPEADKPADATPASESLDAPPPSVQAPQPKKWARG